MEKIRILCYGDSNTYGLIPNLEGKVDERYGIDIRYTKVIARLLGDEYEVIEEGMRGRNIAHDDIKFPQGNRNGFTYFAPCMYSHDPIDYLVIMLGTNELKYEYNMEVNDIIESLEKNYIKFTRKVLKSKLSKVPKIVIVAPGAIHPIENETFTLFKGASRKSALFNSEYKKMSERNNCLFVDNEGLQAGEDNIHLTPESHILLANKIYKVIMNDNK